MYKYQRIWLVPVQSYSVLCTKVIFVVSLKTLTILLQYIKPEIIADSSGTGSSFLLCYGCPVLDPSVELMTLSYIFSDMLGPCCQNGTDSWNYRVQCAVILKPTARRASSTRAVLCYCTVTH